MGLPSGTAVASSLLLALLLAATVHANPVSGLFCVEPPEGTYEVKHFTAEVDSETGGRTLLGEGLYNLTRAFPGAYTGNGIAMYHRDPPQSVNGYEFVFQTIGSFNTDFCVMSGSVYNLQTDPPVIGAIRWEFDGVFKMYGSVNILMKQEFREAYDVDRREYFELVYSGSE